MKNPSLDATWDLATIFHLKDKVLYFSGSNCNLSSILRPVDLKLLPDCFNVPYLTSIKQHLFQDFDGISCFWIFPFRLKHKRYMQGFTQKRETVYDRSMILQ